MAGTFRVTGLTETLAKTDAMGKATKAAVRDILRDVGNRVAGDARARFLSPRLRSQRTALGFRPYVRRAGAISVEQSLRKTTGRRSDWGKTQMRDGLYPAVEAQEAATQADLEAAMDAIAARYLG